MDVPQPAGTANRQGQIRSIEHMLSGTGQRVKSAAEQRFQRSSVLCLLFTAEHAEGAERFELGGRVAYGLNLGLVGSAGGSLPLISGS